MLPSGAAMPPWAVPVWERVGYILESTARLDVAAGLQRRHQPRAARADNHRIELVVFGHERPALPSTRAPRR